MSDKGRRLQFIKYTRHDGKYNYALYKCQCGKTIETRVDRVLGGGAKSCGCSRKTHGLTNHPLYKKILRIIQRCHNPKNAQYSKYGKRGISVCYTWRNEPNLFVSWAKKNGWKPELQIDRIDNDGDYHPDNCRWVTAQENIQNSRNVSLTQKEVALIKYLMKATKLSNPTIAGFYGVSRNTIWRVRKGTSWSNIRPMLVKDLING